MPPKVRIAKEDIVKTAVELVRKNGAGSINARAIAAELECSTQPIFSNFATMDASVPERMMSMPFASSSLSKASKIVDWASP